MPRISEYRSFWREFRRNFHDTGAIAPSSRYLAAALARYVGQQKEPCRILEVGPGTGAVTRQIVGRLNPQDRLDLVELNDAFVKLLRAGFETDPALTPAASRARVLHQRLEKLPADEPYDLIISGLPLNNFAADDVETILKHFAALLRPGGTLSFFEYIAVRPLRGMVSRRAERQRLRDIGRLLRSAFANEIRRDRVLRNVPPAWVHHLRFAEGAGEPRRGGEAG